MKNFFIYLLIMGITLYGMIMYNQPSLMIVFIFELLMLLMSAALIVYLRFKISSELILPIQRVKKGEPLMMEIQMKNTSFLPVQRLKVNLDYHYNFSKKDIGLSYRKVSMGRVKPGSGVRYFRNIVAA